MGEMHAGRGASVVEDPTQPDRLSSEVEGFIENVDGKPLITTIKVHYKIKAPKGKREEALRGIAIEWNGEVAEE